MRGGTVELEGVVEYKSLPSGLHNVTEDLVYAPSWFHQLVSYLLKKVLRNMSL